MRRIFPLLLAVCSCSQQDADMRPEVGDGLLRPTQVYPNEKILITLWRSQTNNKEQITIFINPDRTLHVIKYDQRMSQELRVPVIHTLDKKTLSESALNFLQQRLFTYRPEKLTEGGITILPKGCPFPNHVPAIINVGFEDFSGKAGYFILHEGCVSPSARRIEADLRYIMSKLPKLKGTDGYGWGA